MKSSRNRGGVPAKLLLAVVSFLGLLGMHASGWDKAHDADDDKQPVEFNIAEASPDGDHALWKTKVHFPFFESTHQQFTRLFDLGLAESLRRSGVPEAEVKRRIKEMREATFLDPTPEFDKAYDLDDGHRTGAVYEKDLSDMFWAIKESFNMKNVSVSNMLVNLVIQDVADKDLPAHQSHSGGHYMRLVLVGVYGCPPKASEDHKDDRLINTLVNACALELYDTHEYFNPNQLLTLLAGACVRINTTAPIQNEDGAAAVFHRKIIGTEWTMGDGSASLKITGNSTCTLNDKPTWYGLLGPDSIEFDDGDRIRQITFDPDLNSFTGIGTPDGQRVK